MNDKLYVSQCLICGAIFSCYFNGIRRKCSDCLPDSCVRDGFNCVKENFARYVINVAYCPIHEKAGLQKYDPPKGDSNAKTLRDLSWVSDGENSD